MNFTQEEVKEIEAHGLSLEQVQEQISIFKNGVPKVKLVAAATVDDGIKRLTEDDEVACIERYEHVDKQTEILKFIPASGAATRMFKGVYKFLDSYDPDKETIDEYIARTDNKEMHRFFNSWKEFPFYEHIYEQVKDENDSKTLEDENKAKLLFIRKMMENQGPDYGNRPKGLLPFHNYESYLVTAFEEHLYEAAAYAENNNQARLHFTVSPEHEKGFREQFENVHAAVSRETDVNFEVTYSSQKPKTDTVAVKEDNTLYRKPDGDLLFRPGGHGALIENLNDVNADIIFIKNIDNVLVNNKLRMLARNKKVLAGLLIELQQQVFKFTEALEKQSISEEKIKEIEDFLQQDFSTKLGDDYFALDVDKKKEALLQILDRPMRVCGMVKNEGEPGGGPFWVKNENGDLSLQIIESAQVDQDDEKQHDIFQESTHFNPVDIVCGVRDRKGQKYDLTRYVDDNLAFIANKTANGNKIKALELPGLWNGGMAFWNTIFVEVPVETFNPVKTVNDLLKPSHQVDIA